MLRSVRFIPYTGMANPVITIAIDTIIGLHVVFCCLLGVMSFS